MNAHSSKDGSSVKDNSNESILTSSSNRNKSNNRQEHDIEDRDLGWLSV